MIHRRHLLSRAMSLKSEYSICRICRRPQHLFRKEIIANEEKTIVVCADLPPEARVFVEEFKCHCGRRARVEFPEKSPTLK
jgi:hypothetical protein